MLAWNGSGGYRVPEEQSGFALQCFRGGTAGPGDGSQIVSLSPGEVVIHAGDEMHFLGMSSAFSMKIEQFFHHRGPTREA